jgi:hypothetical protein
MSLAIERRLPKNYVTGLYYALGTDTDHDIDVETGSCRDEDNSSDIIHTGPTTFQLDGTAGPNALDTGSPANNSWYALYIISKDDGTVATVASLASTWGAVTKTNLTGYSYGRRIGYLRTDGSANLVWFRQAKNGQRKRWHYWDNNNVVLDTEIVNNGTATAYSDCNLRNGGEDDIAPSAVKALVELEHDRTNTSASIWGQVRPKNTSFNRGFRTSHALVAANATRESYTFILPTNIDGSRVIQYDNSGTSMDCSVRVFGWEDSL